MKRNTYWLFPAVYSLLAVSYWPFCLQAEPSFVAEVVLHKGAKMENDTDVGVCEQGKFAVCMVAQLFGRA